MYDYEKEREKERKKERERERARAIFEEKNHPFLHYQHFSNNSNFFADVKFSQTFHTFQQTSTLFTFVCHCSNDASMHNFCACLPLVTLLNQ